MGLHGVHAAGRRLRHWRAAAMVFAAILCAGLLAPVDQAAAQVVGNWTFTKAASPTTYSAAGQVINYTYVLTNNGVGDNALSSIAVTDNKTTVSCPGTTLADGASMTCTGSYTITGTDVSNGSVTNTATANVQVTSDHIPDQKTAQATVTYAAPPPAKGSITIVAQASGGDPTFNFTSTVPGSPSFTLVAASGGSASQSFSSLTAGTYTFTEVNLPLHWKLSALTCTGETGGLPTTVNVSSLTATVGLDAGETITCTFSNVFDIGGHIQQTEAVIQNFLTHRLELLAGDEPDRNRFVRRIPGSLWGNADPLPGETSGSPLSFAGNDGAMSSQMSISTSLSQIAMAYAKSNGPQQAPLLGKAPAKPVEPLASTYGVDIWAEAHFNEYRANTGTLDNHGHFNIVYAGADYLLTSSILVGALVEYDLTAELTSVNNSSASGNGWMAGPYMTARLTPNVFFDARAAWGTSSNSVNPFGQYQDGFATDRWLARANLTGNWWFGGFRVTPSAEVLYVSEQQRSYTDLLGVFIPSQTVSLGRFGAGPEFGYRIVGHDGTTYEPQASIKAMWNFVKPGDTIIDGLSVNNDTFSAMAQAGLMVHLRNGYAIRLVGQYDGIGSSDFRSYGGQVWVNVPLH